MRNSCLSSCNAHDANTDTESIEQREKDVAEALCELRERDVAAEISPETRDIIEDAASELTNSIPELTCSKAVQVTESCVNRKRFCITDLISNDTEMNAFTGVHSIPLFNAVCEAVRLLETNTDSFLLNISDRIFLVLMKLKLDISFICLSVLFQVTPQTCKNYFQYTVQLMAIALKTVIYLPEKEAILHNMPECFKDFKNTRLVLDCTEVPVQKSRCLNCRMRTYSHYKGTTTIKFLIGALPSGMIAFLSKVYGGRASDKEIFNQSSIMEKLIPTADALMVDKGFLIERECLENRIALIRPPFLGKNTQLSESDSLLNVNIAAARVHVERSIQRVKMFKILDGGKIKYNMLPYMDEITTVICGIVNLSRPILSADKFL